MGMRVVLQKNNPTVVLGDLNSGLAAPESDIIGYNENSMRLVSEMGFADVVSGCTWCDEGSANLASSGQKNELVASWIKNVTLDHILLRKASGVKARKVHKTFTFQDFSTSVDGKWFSLSDHIGVSAELTWEGAIQ